MWCPDCQADVATEVASDGQSLLCTSCGAEIRKVFAPSLHPETRSARELLERWAAEELLDGPDDNADLPPATGRAAPRRPAGEERRNRADGPADERQPARKKPAGPKFRVDAPHPTAEVIAGRRATQPPQQPPVTPTAAAAQPLPPGYHQHPAHTAVRPPHFDVQAVVENPETSGRSESLWGQMLAYLGVGVLTVGTVLVLWGHFGSVATYSSTGWLVATGGQMLLLLGVVTLVSGGMQQTTHEVSRRVEHIGDRIVRIEQSTRELLQGPHFAQVGGEHDHALAGVEDETEMHD
ncbi:MAG: hypothetical protein ACK5Q5_16590 [Planctomycetaceae bacterium]